MNRPVFTSPFASAINQYLDIKAASGFKEHSFYFPLRTFDRFCKKEKISEPVFTREMNERWILRGTHEAATTHYSRVNAIKHFLMYLAKEGFSVYVSRDVKFIPTDFSPHIYTDDEIKRFFLAVDNYRSPNNPKNAIQLPIIYRTLYCCGTRITETLSIRKKNVDLENGIIKLHMTKNSEHRYIVLSDEMADLYRQFADKCFYLLGDDDYIFTNSRGRQFSQKSFHELHTELLRRANIPYIGDGEGPRLHDWRHTFAVRAFKQLSDSGWDMYYALPILSTYLGHKTIYATEGYIRLVNSYYPDILRKYEAQLETIFGESLYEDN